MKKIINGKRYNTETAKCLGRASHNGLRNDFHYWEEDLYVTAKGNYFVVGSGGPMSRFSEAVGNGRYGGSDLRAVTRAEAFAWAEENDDVDEEHFADMLEDA